ncbi:hypothetical protein [Acerihabitans sp.]|uniref:hypothetical protein n=1 Tax=Acerihabitans sp. TaxID=2811394 RepID=UPI002ED7DDB0
MSTLSSTHKKGTHTAPSRIFDYYKIDGAKADLLSKNSLDFLLIDTETGYGVNDLAVVRVTGSAYLNRQYSYLDEYGIGIYSFTLIDDVAETVLLTVRIPGIEDSGLDLYFTFTDAA